MLRGQRRAWGPCWNTLLWLDNIHSIFLDIPFTEEDTVDVINGMAAGKAPGLDGLTAQFYKEYASLLAPAYRLSMRKQWALGFYPLLYVRLSQA